eukprot:s4292_g3.t1
MQQVGLTREEWEHLKILERANTCLHPKPWDFLTVCDWSDNVLDKDKLMRRIRIVVSKSDDEMDVEQDVTAESTNGADVIQRLVLEMLQGCGDGVADIVRAMFRSRISLLFGQTGTAAVDQNGWANTDRYNMVSGTYTEDEFQFVSFLEVWRGNVFQDATVKCTGCATPTLRLQHCREECA